MAYNITNNPDRPGYEICVGSLVSKQHLVIAIDHHHGPRRNAAARRDWPRQRR